jgi:hypothetical protein
MLVPVSLGPLEKFEVVLHAALAKGLHGNGLLNRVFGEDVWNECYVRRVLVTMGSVTVTDCRDVLWRTLKFWR